MEDVQRLFIAIELSENVRRWLREAGILLKGSMPSGTVRWTDPNAIHLTLKFLGETPSRRAADIRAAMDGLVPSFRPFPLTAGGLGCFPNTARPRVIWAGIHADPLLGDLQKRFEEELERIGFPAERRAFSPHLTLGRVKDGVSGARLAEIGRAVEAVSLESTAGMDVMDVCLYKSVLRPGGAEYTVLHRATFTG
ncbi:MAG: RNA 2',3'-cyclic phosphodiesterase [Anaerolineales bacterium]